MKKYIRRRPRHFFIFGLFFFICIFRTDVSVRLLQGTFLLPLSVSDCMLLGCAVFLLFFLYITAVGYRFDEGGCAKKYPLLREKYYSKEMMKGDRAIQGVSNRWLIYLRGKKKQKLILPGYIPGMEEAVKDFLHQAQIPPII